MNLQDLTPLPGLRHVIRLKSDCRASIQAANEQFWQALAQTLKTAGFEYVSPDEYGLLAAQPSLYDACEGDPHYAIHYTRDQHGFLALTFKVIGVRGYGQHEYGLVELLRTLDIPVQQAGDLQRQALKLCLTLRHREYTLASPLPTPNDPDAVREVLKFMAGQDNP